MPGKPFLLSAGESSDPAGRPLTYAWDLDGSGRYATTTDGDVLETSFVATGDYPIGLKVTNDAGQSAVATTSVHALFWEVTFTDKAEFNRAIFISNALFAGAAFMGDAWFDSEVTFADAALFGEVTFIGDALFNKSTKQRLASRSAHCEPPPSDAGAGLADNSA